MGVFDPDDDGNAQLLARFPEAVVGTSFALDGATNTLGHARIGQRRLVGIEHRHATISQAPRLIQKLLSAVRALKILFDKIRGVLGVRRHRQRTLHALLE